MKIMQEQFQLLLTKKNKNKQKWDLHDLYESFPNKDQYTKEDFFDIIKTCNSILHNYIMSTGHVIKLPRRLGTLSVRTSKGNCVYIDYQHFKKTGEVVKLQNRHSDGKIAKIYWDKRSPYCVHKHKDFFIYTPTRQMKRLLAKKIFDDNTISLYYPKDYLIS